MNQPGARLAGWVVAAVLCVCFVWLQVARPLDDGGTGIVGRVSHSNDYKHVYLGSMLLFEGLSPYDAENMLTTAGAASAEDGRFRTILPYVYLPFTGLAMRPFSQLPFAQSVVAFQVANHLMLIVALALVLWSSGLWTRWGSWSVAVAAGLVAFNAALFRQNLAGQLNVVLLLCWAVVYTADRRGWHPAVAGGVAAFGALFKLSPGILILWFLLRRRWSEALWMSAIGAALMGISIGAFGLRVHLDFIPVLRDMGFGKSTWSEFGHTFWRDDYNQSINALMHRLLVPMEGRPAPWIAGSATLANGLTWAFALGLLGIWATACWRAPAAAHASTLAMTLGASLLLPSICWDHYLVQLLPGILLLAAAGPTLLTGRNALLAVAAILVSVPIPFHELGGGIGLLAGSAKLPAALIVFAVGAWDAFRPEPSSPLSDTT